MLGPIFRLYNLLLPQFYATSVVIGWRRVTSLTDRRRAFATVDSLAVMSGIAQVMREVCK